MSSEIFLIVLSILLSGGRPIQQESDIKKTEWLLGVWENKTSRGSMYESWKKVGDRELAGRSFMVKQGDTIVFENIRLVDESNRLYYIPTVKNQNDNMPVRFSAKEISDSVMIFENPQHDFPQLITYTKISADSLVAEISGTKNGQYSKRKFPMKRVVNQP